MKYLYNFTEGEIRVVYNACLAFRPQVQAEYSAEELHSLDSIITYCRNHLEDAQGGKT